MSATRIAGLSLTSADADALAEFYLALGCERSGIELRGGPAFAHLAQVAHPEAQVVLLRLGEEWLELVTFAERGRPYPPDRASNDPWFQHFAIVVASMEDAYARLARLEGWTPITQPVPQRLPESSGGVTAFKFRDPEGHPLELLEFPADRMPAVWRTRAASRRRLFLGIDHSAVVVASTERSVEFYEQRLAFELTGSSHNRGAEQAQLDGLRDPDVEVTALATAGARPPHLELLCYRAPRLPASRAAPLESCDVAATRLLIATNDSARMRVALGMEQLPPEIARCGALLHDPDGHALLLVPRG